MNFKPQISKRSNTSWSGLCLFLGIIGFSACNTVDNTHKSGKLHIPTGASFDQIMDSISPFLKNPDRFKSYANGEKLGSRHFPGRYSLKVGMSNKDIIQMIQMGAQDEIPIRIGNYASITELAGKLGKILESDSQQLLSAMVQAPNAAGLDTAKILYRYLPNTYNFHWNTSGAQFVEKLEQAYNKFWDEEKLAQAETAGLTPLEITTLASIVQLESAREDEQARVAALYLNRLKIGMKLDADPTIVFIKKQQNGFTQKVQRVYYKDLHIASPYNTYRNRGLPPSPICMPNPSAIKAVLQPEAHEYIYFVADTAKPGYHLFAKTLVEQEKNAAAYRKWANNNKVK